MKTIFIIFILFVLSYLNAKAQWELSIYGDKANCMTVSGSTIYAGFQNDGIYYSKNEGDSWSHCFSPVWVGGTASNIYSIAINESRIVAGTDARMEFSSNLTGGSWTQPYYACMVNDQEIDVLASNGNYIYAGWGNHGYFVSNDGGNSFSSWDNIPGSYQYSIAASGNYVFVGTDIGVYLSNDNGNDWYDINYGLPTTAIKALAISGANILAGTSDSGVYLSTDNGLSWNARNSGLGNLSIRSLAVSENIIVANTGGGIFQSNNNGTSWFDITNGLLDEEPYVSSVSIVSPFSPLYYVFARAYGGIYRSAISNGIEERKTNNFNIYINPNPTKDKFTITFSNYRENYTLEILNSFGQVVLSKKMNGANTTKQIDLSGQSAGVYFVKLQSGNNTIVKKIIKQD